MCHQNLYKFWCCFVTSLFKFSKTLPTGSTTFTVPFSVLVALHTEDLKLSWLSFQEQESGHITSLEIDYITTLQHSDHMFVSSAHPPDIYNKLSAHSSWFLEDCFNFWIMREMTWLLQKVAKLAHNKYAINQCVFIFCRLFTNAFSMESS